MGVRGGKGKRVDRKRRRMFVRMEKEVKLKAEKKGERTNSTNTLHPFCAIMQIYALSCVLVCKTKRK